MTVTTLRAPVRPSARTTLETLGTWYAHAADAPPTTPGRHISTSRAWAAAWENVTTEPVLAHRHLHLSDGTGPGDLVSYYLIEGSPYWAAVERDAAIGLVFTGPVVYAGTPYGEYGGAGSAGAGTIRYAVSAGVDLVREWGAQALVVPGLTTDLAHRWTAAARPDADLFFDLAHVAPVYGSLYGFLDTMPSAKHAREMRRQRRRGLEQGLTFRRLHGRDMLPLLPQFTDLADAAAVKNGGSLYGTDIFAAVASIPGAVLLAAEHDGDLVGGFLCFHYRGRPVPVGRRHRLPAAADPARPDARLGGPGGRPRRHRHRRRPGQLPLQAQPRPVGGGAAHARLLPRPRRFHRPRPARDGPRDGGLRRAGARDLNHRPSRHLNRCPIASRKGPTIVRILIINRWDDELSDFGRVIDHDLHQVTYVTVPSHLPMIPATAAGTVVLDSLSDTAGVIAAAESLYRLMGGVDRILAMSEYDLLTGATLRERWDVPGATVAELTPFRDKAAAKTVLAAAGTGLLTPRFEPVGSIAEVTAFARRCNAGVIVKPRDGAGSLGCYRIRPGRSAAAVLQGVDLSGYEVEEWIEAPVWHIDGLLHDGDPVAVYPSRYLGTCLDFTQLNAPVGSVVQHGPLAHCMAAFVVQCVTWLGLREGVFHLEAFEAQDGPVFLEAAARVSGGPIPFSIRDIYGVDLVADWIRLHLGEPAHRTRPQPRTVRRQPHAAQPARAAPDRTQPSTRGHVAWAVRGGTAGGRHRLRRAQCLRRPRRLLPLRR
ncbi:hypothetical protein ACIP98_38235 [Streptomyces sp. NPDC088354]|uniref:ATP-grasp domain-containing protein n=1 Tax=Streptomyces sp. NPDC088354 TaxID=3365856 RepID=UPI0038166C68